MTLDFGNGKGYSDLLPGLLILNIQHSNSTQFTSILLEGKGCEDSLSLGKKKLREMMIPVFLIFFLLSNWGSEALGSPLR